MLDERIIDKLVERLVNRIEQGNIYVLEQIGKSIKKIGTLSPSKAQQLINVFKYGGNYDKIVQKLARITELNVKDIYEIFEEVAKSDYQFAKQFYDYRNVKYIPYEKNIALQNQVKALARITANKYANLSNTLAFTKKINGRVVYTDLARTYQETIDKAVLSVAQGKNTFDEQMYSVVKEIGSSGLKTVDYANGRSMRLDSAVRTDLKGALRNLHNEMQAVFGEQFGADGVEISVHFNPAPDHAEVQGRQFSKKEFEKFQNDQDAVDYQGKLFTKEHDDKDRRSISEYNCYHYTFDIVLGISKPNYSNEELQKIIDDNNKGFELDGQHYTNYEGTQLQRQLETKIRQQKDMQIMAKASGNKELIQESQQKITQLTQKYKELSQVSGLPTKMERMRVSGYRRTKVNINNRSNKVNYLGINIKRGSNLYKKIENEKQIYHSTNNLKEIYESNYITGNLAVQNKNTRIVNYGYESVQLKPEALNYTTKLYNGDRGNDFTSDKAEKLRTTNINEFINLAGKKHIHSTAVVERMPFLENVKSIRTYKESDNYKLWKKISKQYNIPLKVYSLGYKPKIIKKDINYSNRK